MYPEPSQSQFHQIFLRQLTICHDQTMQFVNQIGFRLVDSLPVHWSLSIEVIIFKFIKHLFNLCNSIMSLSKYCWILSIVHFENHKAFYKIWCSSIVQVLTIVKMQWACVTQVHTHTVWQQLTPSVKLQKIIHVHQLHNVWKYCCLDLNTFHEKMRSDIFWIDFIYNQWVYFITIAILFSILLSEITWHQLSISVKTINNYIISSTSITHFSYIVNVLFRK